MNLLSSGQERECFFKHLLSYPNTLNSLQLGVSCGEDLICSVLTVPQASAPGSVAN